MASTWSALKIELLETGANSGTWGTLTNANLGDAVLGEAITGSATVDFSADADVTVTLTDVATTQAARNLRLNITESGAGIGSVRNLILGSGCQIEKFYLVRNNGTGAKTIKNTSGTGISVPAGKSTLVYNDGTNVVDGASYFTSLTLGSALPVASGGTGLTSGTSGGVLAYTASGTLASSAALTQYGVVYGGGAGAVPVATAAGTTGQVLTATTSGAPSWSSPATSGTVTTVGFTGGIVTVTNPTTTPAFTIAGTSGGIPYFASGATWATSAALTQYGVVYGGGAGATPVATANGTTGQAFIATTSGAPSWGTLPVAGGGTGATTLATNNVLLGNGTSALQVIAPSTSGNVLTSNGSTWASTAPVAAAPSFPYAARTSNTILTATEKSYFIEVTGASTFTQTLTAAATLGNGWFVWLRNAGTGVVTVDPNGSETIGGTTTAALNPGDYWLIVCNGTNFTLARIDGTNSQTYSTGTGNFTAPSGVYRVHARIWGAGGGSRDGALPGGSGGGYSEGYLAITPGGTLAYAVGAGVSNGTGGNTTLSTMTANGGATSGGAGGTATGGSLLNVSGGTGARSGGVSAVGIGGGAFGTPSLAAGSGRVFGLVPGGGSQTFSGIDAGIAGADGAIIITWV